MRKSNSSTQPSDLTSQTTADDVRSNNISSGDALASNPWSSEITSLDLERVVSDSQTTVNSNGSGKTSAKEADGYVTATSNDGVSFNATTPSHLEVPAAKDEPNGTSPAPKPTRRKKTVTKTTPHTFELADELKKQQSLEAKPEAKPETSSDKGSPQPPPSIEKPAIKLSYSTIRTSLDVKPIDPPPRPRREEIPNNPFTADQRKASKPKTTDATSTPIKGKVDEPYIFYPSPSLSIDHMFQKVIVLTHGTSLIGSALIRQFHTAGARVVFGDTNADKAKKLLASLGPPDIIHFNECHTLRYPDLVALFKLAMTMYGRVDHAIFGVGDDGGVGITVGEAESFWGLDLQAKTKPGKQEIDEAIIETSKDGFDAGDVIGASVKFARLAMAHLRNSPASRKKRVSSYSGVNGEDKEEERRKPDRSLTFITSVAGIKGIPHLPVYQAAQHASLAVLRSLRTSIDPQKDNIRINAVMTNMMVPTVIPQAGGRMSVSLPSDRPEDVARVVASVVGDAVAGDAASDGSVFYITGEQAVDVQDGLDRSEALWLGPIAKGTLDKASSGVGQGCHWMLGLGVDA